MRSLALAVVLAALLAGCTREGPGEILETARFEEVQRNTEHARKLYERIVEQYPESPEAVEARQRLAVLGAAPAAP